jgi:hypothetical protein
MQQISVESLIVNMSEFHRMLFDPSLPFMQKVFAESLIEAHHRICPESFIGYYPIDLSRSCRISLQKA